MTAHPAHQSGRRRRCLPRWPLARAVEHIERKVDQIMASVQDLQDSLAQEQADTAALVTVVDGLAAAVQTLIGQVGTVPADVQAAIDGAVSTLSSTHVDTSSVEQRLSDLTSAASAAGGIVAPPVDGGPSV